jgi:hypothetical protein
LASKVTRTALIAVSALGTSGVLAMSAEAATPPTIPSALVNQPAVTAATAVTPESATLNGVIDTGGNPGSTFTLPANTTLLWDNSFNLIGGSSTTTEHVDGLPADDSTATYPTSSSSILLNNGGADNYSTVLFEYDPASDYDANGDNFGPETSFATEFNAPTLPGLSVVQTTVGAYPAASSDSLSGPLTPGTEYVYGIEQQAGATDAATTINTFSGSSTGVNPTYSCYPNAYIAAVSPYNGYTPTGTLSGGITATGGPAQTTPQPEIQGPCVYYYGGGANYYDSAVGSFTTPSLGKVLVANGKITAAKKIVTKTSTKVVAKKKVTTKSYTTVLSNIKGSVVVEDQSVEKAAGSLQLTYAGKLVGSARFAVSAQATKTVALSLTAYGKQLASTGKLFTSKLTYSSTTDQPTTTKNVTL